MEELTIGIHFLGGIDMVKDINDNQPHKVSEVICIGCKYRWLAVRPTKTLLKDLECPGVANKVT